jgi:hypothetical protein
MFDFMGNWVDFFLFFLFVRLSNSYSVFILLSNKIVEIFFRIFKRYLFIILMNIYFIWLDIEFFLIMLLTKIIELIWMNDSEPKFFFFL